MKTNRIDRRNPVTFALFLGLFVAGTLAGACAGEDEPPAENGQANEAAESAGGVEYEPAYPEDVSAEELSAEDTAQQEAHSHADGTSHSHGEEDDPDHGDGEGEHEHDGDEDHDH
jgi:hypothetical protein